MNQRYQSVDALCGLIMIIMAIDHASGFIARQHGSEFWAGAMSSYAGAFPFLTRWITHLCAPGFFFLLGAGVYWFADARRQSGWSERQIALHTAKRGFAIFLAGQLLENPVLFLQSLLAPARVSLNRITAPPPIDGSELYWGFITLSGLGVVMIVCALLIRLPRWTWALTVVLCVVATNTWLPADGKPGPLWNAILLAPGLSQHVFVVYPVIPWLAAAAAGLAFGHLWKTNPGWTVRRLWVIGLVLLAVAVALRAAGGWGNIRPPRDAGWIEFLNNVKYPPSLVFLLSSLGIDLLLLWLLIKLPSFWRSPRSPLIIFGQTPLFFYLVHFYLLLGLAFLFFRVAASLEVAYLVWAGVVVALIPFCVKYREFKMSKPPESLWRLF